MLKRMDIERVLDKTGMPRRTKGYQYIVEVLLLIDDDKFRNLKLTTKYEIIAEKYNTSWQLVEKNIRYTFATTRDNGDNYEEVDHYLGFINTQNLNTLMYLYDKIIEEQDKRFTEYLETVSKNKLKQLLFELLKDDLSVAAYA